MAINQLLFGLLVYLAQESQLLLIRLKKSSKLGHRTFVLDGDNVRHGLSSDLTFSSDDRRKNIRRVGEVAKIMMEAGVITLAAFISPFKKDRDFVRGLLAQGVLLKYFVILA